MLWVHSFFTLSIRVTHIPDGDPVCLGDLGSRLHRVVQT